MTAEPYEHMVGQPIRLKQPTAHSTARFSTSYGGDHLPYNVAKRDANFKQIRLAD